MWESLFIQPLFNLLVAIYSILPVKDLGLAVIGVVIVIRLLLLPLSKKAVQTQIAMQKLQPEIAAIQKKHKGNREAETKALLALWKDHKVNPFASILILFLQLPILIALYQVFLGIVAETNDISRLLWDFMPYPGELTASFLGTVDLAAPSMLIAFLAGVAQFFQTKLMIPSLSSQDNSFQVTLMRQMLYIGPILTLVVLWMLPAVVGLYWTATSLWSIGEYHFTIKPKSEGKKISNKK